MSTRPLLELIPRSISGRSRLVLSGLALLVLAQGATAVWALRTAARASHELARERVARLQDAQDLVQRTMLIEREAGQLLQAGTLTEVTGEYAAILRQLDELDALVERFGAASSDVELLALEQASQLFRNVVHVVARLRNDALQDELALSRSLEAREAALEESRAAGAGAVLAILARLRAADPAAVEALRSQLLARAGEGRGLPTVIRDDLRSMRAGGGPAGDARDPFSLCARFLDRRATLERYHDALHGQTIRMVASAQALSERLTADYRGAVRALAERTRASEWSVLALLAGSLALAWLVGPVLLRRQVLDRLEAVSQHLRRKDASEDPPEVPVAGRDEIAEMARAVERLLVGRQRLAEANQELEALNAELRRTQAELVQSQKLEAVGRLAAGIAHEINTPIQFVNDSVDFVKDAFRDLLRVLAAYGELRDAASGGGPVPAAVLDPVVAEEEAIGLSYLVDQVPRALERSVDGLSRVAVIVRAMKEFAHPDDKEKAPADLNAALRSTIIIARNEYKYVAEVEAEFGPVPQVPCHIGELNQVFLNVIVNAAHAIGEVKAPGHKGIIRVQTRLDGGQVRVSISDNGAGIPEAIRHRIFDPFFTTKGVGKGTGQGLAIARSVVVEKHGGTLTFESELGVGTTFHVCIPVESR